MTEAPEPFTSEIPLPQYELWKRTEKTRIPITFTLELTARCNLNCRHCYINLPAGDAQATRRELSLSEIDTLTSQAVELGALWCLIAGGEPLLRPDFADIYRLLKRKGLLVSVFTNACLVTDEHVRLFQEYPPREIEVTVYGITPETFGRVTRRPASYSAFRSGLERLLKGGIKVRLKTMALRSNLAELKAIAEFCRAQTSDSFRFDPLLHLRLDGNHQRNAEKKPAPPVKFQRGKNARPRDFWNAARALTSSPSAMMACSGCANRWCIRRSLITCEMAVWPMPGDALPQLSAICRQKPTAGIVR